MSARVDDLLRDLRVELEHAAPSAGFRQRVRAHAIAQRRVGRSRVVVPAVLAAAAALFLTARSLTPVPDSVPVPRALQVLASPSSIDATPLATPAATPNRPRQAAAVVARVSVSTFRQPEVLVPPDQEIALRQWLAALGAARDPRSAETDAGVVPPIVPVEIAPIHIEPIAAGPSGGKERLQ